MALGISKKWKPGSTTFQYSFNMRESSVRRIYGLNISVQNSTTFGETSIRSLGSKF